MNHEIQERQGCSGILSSNGPIQNEPPPVLPPPLPSPCHTAKPFPWGLLALGAGGLIALMVTIPVAAVLLARAAAPAQSERTGRNSPAVARDDAGPEPGVSYKHETVASEPWSIHVLKIDRSRQDLTFFTAHARDKVLAVSLLAEQARSVPREFGRAIAAVNGDFYLRDNPMYAGDPRGLQIMNGDLISAPDTVCVWFDTAGAPHLDEVKSRFTIEWPDGRKTEFGLNQRRGTMLPVLYTPSYGTSTRASAGRELVLEKEGNGAWLPLQAGQTYTARVREIRPEGNTVLAADTMVLSFPQQLLGELPEIKPGLRLQISTATTPDLKGVRMAIGGGPALIQNGKHFALTAPPPGTPADYSQRSRYERHPRCAVGWSATHVFLVIVDGRQPGLSVGMKLAELAEYMAGLGCTEAMNLDGGKSAQMWMSGRIMNSPAQGEDTVANSILVVRKADARSGATPARVAPLKFTWPWP